ncbi:AI-2E family transporter [Flavobacterium psychrophilum]|uniref:AI-2E family transporter n=1 Tax=Flavobacterium psychrophilum TaxID=96345 RepID=UPI0009099D63|nr:AI-2E family transporter [Flavobacterium psychrophilum]EKT2072620.1 AI-2E family transporter [Flavobacterium psychrophilum]EKT4492133.1 AI-2E family transporter [Flavobacterium psychrophilum]SHH93000.1 Putative transporting permease [Flavobacterium psychrophilum]
MTTSLSSVIKKMLVLFLVFSGLYFAQEFLIPLCIGGVLATLFLPFCNWMEKKKIPKGLAVFISFLGLLALIFLLISLLGYKISELINDIEILKQKGIEAGTKIQKYIFDTLNLTVTEQYKILKSEQPSYGDMAQKMLGSMTSFLSNSILLLVYFIFLLYYRNHIKNFLVCLTPKSQQVEMQEIIQKVATVSQQYLIGLSKMIFLLWVMYGIGFSIIGVENAIFFAILCGLLEIIPFVGNITGTTLTVLIAAMNGANTQLLFGIVIVYGIVQFIQGWVLEPLIVGSQVKINSLFTIIALVLGELLWGISGIILAIPLTAMFKIVCDHIEPLKPYGFLIGEIETPKTAIGIVEKLKKSINTKNET